MFQPAVEKWQGAAAALPGLRVSQLSVIVRQADDSF
jgi:hypothetical protein